MSDKKTSKFNAVFKKAFVRLCRVGNNEIRVSVYKPDRGDPQISFRKWWDKEGDGNWGATGKGLNLSPENAAYMIVAAYYWAKKSKRMAKHIAAAEKKYADQA